MPLPNRTVPASVVVTLEDEVQALAGKRIAWSTYWKLCWQPQPAAIYEIQAVTSEGIFSRLRRLNASCYRLQAAARRNQRSQGLFNRDAILAFQASQLAFQVRAVRADGTVSPWSAAYTVGRATSSARRG